MGIYQATYPINGQYPTFQLQGGVQPLSKDPFYGPLLKLLRKRHEKAKKKDGSKKCTKKVKSTVKKLNFDDKNKESGLKTPENEKTKKRNKSINEEVKEENVDESPPVKKSKLTSKSPDPIIA